jgi:hypothetical protein
MPPPAETFALLPFTILAAAPPRRERGRFEDVLKPGESDAGIATKADAEAIVARITDLRSIARTCTSAPD